MNRRSSVTPRPTSHNVCSQRGAFFGGGGLGGSVGGPDFAGLDRWTCGDDIESPSPSTDGTVKRRASERYVPVRRSYPPDVLKAYGITVIAFMMLMYALEHRDPRFVLAFAVGCALS